MILHLPTKFIQMGLSLSYQFFKVAATESEIYFRLRFSGGTRLGMSKSICTPNFDETSQSTAELLLPPVCENGRPPYLNSTSGFDFDIFIFMGMAFFIGREYLGWRLSYLLHEAALKFCSRLASRWNSWMMMMTPPHCLICKDATEHVHVDLLQTTMLSSNIAVGPCTRNHGGCNHFCFTLSSTTRICDCALGFSLASDNMTCNPRKSYTAKSL